MKNKNYKKAFSLIEIIFVISILGIIATFAIPKFLDSRSGAIVTTIQKDISTITTSIQAQYMLNNSIDKITDAVSVNEKNWKIEDKKLKYITDDKVCVEIILQSNSLEVQIHENSSELCKKLYEAGVRDNAYELI